jgi:hypothetical protein
MKVPIEIVNSIVAAKGVCPKTQALLYEYLLVSDNWSKEPCQSWTFEESAPAASDTY